MLATPYSPVLPLLLRAFLLWASAALSACGRSEPAAESAPAGAEAAAPATAREPRYDHVVLVTLDTLRADHLADYGYARETAPFIAHLAREGVLFENALSAVSHTAPSHATMLTGLPPRMHGVRKNGNKLKDHERSLPALLRARGFASGAFVSTVFLGGIALGFDHVVNTAPTTPALVDQAAAWARAQGERPYFLWLHLFEPHKWKRPKVPAWARSAIAASHATEPGTFYEYVARLHGYPPLAPEAPFDIPWLGIDSRGFAHGPESRAEVLQYVDDYDALIRMADAEIQRLYETLEQPAERRNGLWILTCDHGEGLGSHGYEGHGARIYNEQLRVALLFHATGGALGPRRVPELVGHMDLVPTLAELLAFEWRAPHPEFLGRSLVPLLDGTLDGTLDGAGGFGERLLFAEQRRTIEGEAGDGGEMVAIQDRRHKLIVSPGGEEELFALDRDPLELTPLEGEDARRAELRAALAERLEFFSKLAAGELEEPAPEFLEELKDLGYAR